VRSIEEYVAERVVRLLPEAMWCPKARGKPATFGKRCGGRPGPCGRRDPRQTIWCCCLRFAIVHALPSRWIFHFCVCACVIRLISYYLCPPLLGFRPSAQRPDAVRGVCGGGVVWLASCDRLHIPYISYLGLGLLGTDCRNLERGATSSHQPIFPSLISIHIHPYSA